MHHVPCGETVDLLNAIYALDPFQDPDFWWPIAGLLVEVEVVDLNERLRAYGR